MKLSQQPMVLPHIRYKPPLNLYMGMQVRVYALRIVDT